MDEYRSGGVDLYRHGNYRSEGGGGGGATAVGIYRRSGSSDNLHMGRGYRGGGSDTLRDSETYRSGARGRLLGESYRSGAKNTSYPQVSRGVDKYHLPSSSGGVVETTYRDSSGGGANGRTIITKDKYHLLEELKNNPKYVVRTRACEPNDESFV